MEERHWNLKYILSNITGGKKYTIFNDSPNFLHKYLKNSKFSNLLISPFSKGLSHMLPSQKNVTLNKAIKIKIIHSFWHSTSSILSIQ